MSKPIRGLDLDALTPEEWWVVAQAMPDLLGPWTRGHVAYRPLPNGDPYLSIVEDEGGYRIKGNTADAEEELRAYRDPYLDNGEEEDAEHPRRYRFATFHEATDAADEFLRDEMKFTLVEGPDIVPPLRRMGAWDSMTSRGEGDPARCRRRGERGCFGPFAAKVERDTGPRTRTSPCERWLYVVYVGGPEVRGYGKTREEAMAAADAILLRRRYKESGKDNDREKFGNDNDCEKVVH